MKLQVISILFLLLYTFNVVSKGCHPEITFLKGLFIFYIYIYRGLWLEIQTAVNRLLWGLETELSSSARAIPALNSKPLSNRGNDSPHTTLRKIELVHLLVSMVPQYFL